MKVWVKNERVREANAQSTAPAGASKPLGGRLFPNGMLENEAPDAVFSSLSRTGGRAKCNQIISQDCSEFKDIV